MRNSSLKQGSLSQGETLGQSLASIAPTATPAMGLPFILTVCGNGSWLACVLVLLALACVGYQVNTFARRSCSAGSLYSFVAQSLGGTWSVLAGCALLVAYLGTACAVTGGLVTYTFSLFGPHLARTPATVAAISIVGIALAALFAYRDVQLSARLMLLIEAVSILLILLLFFLPGTHSALSLDRAQTVLEGTSWRQIRAGLVPMIFCFVGFESAASLGEEARDPLRTIPRAITATVWFSGIFFVLCAYAETLILRGHQAALATAEAPLEILAQLRHFPALIPFVATTTMCSFFACVLACLAAAARTLYKLSADGHLHRCFRRTHSASQAPYVAIFVCAGVTMVVAVALLLTRVAPLDVYGWAGSFASYGFVTVYMMIAVASLLEAFRNRRLPLLAGVSLVGSFTILGLAVRGAFEPADAVSLWLPWGYGALVLVFASMILIGRRLRAEAVQPA